MKGKTKNNEDKSRAERYKLSSARAIYRNTVSSYVQYKYGYCTYLRSVLAPPGLSIAWSPGDLTSSGGREKKRICSEGEGEGEKEKEREGRRDGGKKREIKGEGEREVCDHVG